MAGNPFRYGDIATGEYFTNRQPGAGSHSRYHASGQTSCDHLAPPLWQNIAHLRGHTAAAQQKVLVAYLDLFRAPSKDRFADLLAAAVFSGLINPVERVLKDAMRFFQRLPVEPTVTIDPGGMPRFEFSAGQRSRDIDRTIEDLLALPGHIAADRHRHVAIIFDEFQEVLSIDPHLPSVMRAVFQTQGDVAHAFLGSRTSPDAGGVRRQNQPLYKMAKPIVLKPIGHDAFAAFIHTRSPSRAANRNPASTAGTGDNRGHPHDTQELCYFLWSMVQGAHLPAVAGAVVVDTALDQVLDAESAHYTDALGWAGRHQRLLFLALAAEPGALFSESYRRLHRLGPASSVQRSLARLIQREIVEQASSGDHVVADVFCASG